MMPRPKGDNRLSIAEGVWYDARVLEAAGFDFYCCSDSLAQELVMMAELEGAWVEYRTVVNYERMTWEERRYTVDYALFRFKSRARAKRLRDTMKLLDATERLCGAEVGQRYYSCQCQREASVERDRIRRKKYAPNHEY